MWSYWGKTAWACGSAQQTGGPGGSAGLPDMQVNQVNLCGKFHIRPITQSFEPSKDQTLLAASKTRSSRTRGRRSNSIGTSCGSSWTLGPSTILGADAAVVLAGMSAAVRGLYTGSPYLRKLP